MVGGTADNGFGTALLYSGTRGSDWREHSATRIDDLMLKSKYAPNKVHTFNSLLQYYDGEADMPGGLSRADYDADRWQSTRPYDRFWAVASWRAWATSSSRTASINSTFWGSTPKPAQRLPGAKANASPSRRVTMVRGIEPRYSQSFMIGPYAHEVGVGYRYVNESTHEMRYYTATSSGSCRPAQALTTATRVPAPRRTPGIWMTKSTSATGPSRRVCVSNISSHTRTTPSKARTKR